MGLVSAGKGLYDQFSGGEKVPGVPTPEDAGPARGSDYRGFMDEAFPGTTPWERLGSSTGSYPGGALHESNAVDMQRKEFLQQQRLTSMNNRASIIAAASPHGAAAAESGLMQYGFGVGRPYDTHVAQGREGLPSSISERTASARGKFNVADISELPARGARALTSGSAAAGSRFGGRVPLISKRDAQSSARYHYIRNTGKAPRRFQLSS